MWDGIGATLKQYLRNIINASQVDDEKIKTKSGRVASPLDCYQQLQSHFGSSAWEEKRRAMTKATRIRRFTILWAGPKDIQRPKAFQPAAYKRIVGIRSHYQYMALQNQGQVAMRESSCWCHGCMHVAMKGPTGDFLNGLKTPNCVRSVDGAWDAESGQYVGEASYRYERRGCFKTGGAGSKDLVARTGSNGNKLAEGLVVGAWCMFEVETKGESELWLAKVVTNAGWKEGEGAKKHDGGGILWVGEKGAKIRFKPGDFMVSVRWYEKVGERQFRWWEGGVNPSEVQHAANLRLVNFQMRVVKGPDEVLGRQRRGAQAGSERAKERRRVWELKKEDYETALASCIYG